MSENLALANHADDPSKSLTEPTRVVPNYSFPFEEGSPDMSRVPANRLYFGDNLDWLSKMDAGIVDLVYLDPPFNSQATYNLLYKSPDGQAAQAQYQAFVDSWRWDQPADIALARILRSGSPAAEIISALHNYMNKSDMMAYLVMMTARLIELQRVLKPTGSLYLHCDTSASHYLKIILDSVFGPRAFRNEIIWKRTSAHNDARNRYGDVTDTILLYANGEAVTFHRQYRSYSPEYIQKNFRFQDEKGYYSSENLRSPNPRPNLTYDYKGYKPHANGWTVSREKMEQLDKDDRLIFPSSKDGRIRVKKYLHEMPGLPVANLWDDIGPISSQDIERVGYQTQKPLALLKRIIEASSDKGGLVLDPFCGCGTAIEAAEMLERKWIGIDITPLAIDVVERRLSRKGLRRKVDYEVEGVPLDMDGAQRLYDSDSLHLQYELWALTLVDGQPRDGGKAGADKGIDGLIFFQDDARNIGKAVVSVKGGKNVHAQHVRDLLGALTTQRAKMGIFVTMHKTAAMETAAREAGSVEAGGKLRRTIQILTIEELLGGKKPDLPPVHDIISAASAARRAGSRQPAAPTPEEIRQSPSFKLPISGGRKRDSQQTLPIEEPLLVRPQPSKGSGRKKSA